MSLFFKIFGAFSALLFAAAFGAGLWGPQLGLSSGQHLLLGLAAGIVAVSVHCLIFAIFTGAGKDTRLLVEDWDLDKNFLKKSKVFKREVFPPALYCIMFIILTTTFGGVVSAGGSATYRWVHLILATFTFIYHLKCLVQEARAVDENAALLAEVNKVAATVTANRAADSHQVIPGAVEDYEWGTHVYAFGKFMTFMGYNTWLPFIYLKYITRTSQTPFWPFLLLSLFCFAIGIFLRTKYQSFRPHRPQSSNVT